MSKVIWGVLVVLLLAAVGLLYSTHKKGSMKPEEVFAREGGLELVLEVGDTYESGGPGEDIVARTVQIVGERLNQFGVRNASVRREGGRRIVVQLPGWTQPERAEGLIGRRALLEFRLVRESGDLELALQNLDLLLRGVRVDDGPVSGRMPASAAREVRPLPPDTGRGDADLAAKTHGDSILDEMLPPAAYEEARADEYSEERPFSSYIMEPYRWGVFIRERNVDIVKQLLTTARGKKGVPPRSEFLWSMDSLRSPEGAEGKILYLVDRRADVTGRSIVEAETRKDPYDPSARDVVFRLDEDGTARFAELTARNIGRCLAVVLDGEVRSAPVIQSEIPGGEARITGLGSDEEANDLAVLLRAGALPAEITIKEARTVPPAR